MAFNEDKQKKAPSASAGGSTTKKAPEIFQIRIPVSLKQRLEAVAEIRGMTMRNLAEEILTDYVNEYIRKIVESQSKYKG